MIKDRVISLYITKVREVQESIEHGLMINQNIAIEELRRTQGRWSGLKEALDLLENVLEEEDK